MSGTLRRLLLAGTCLCIYGTPVPLRHPHLSSTDDSRCGGQCAGSVAPDTVLLHSDRSARDVQERVAGFPVSVGGGEGAEVGPDGPGTEPKGAVAVIQAENGDSLDGGSVSRKAGRDGEARSQRNQTETVGADSESSSEMTETKEELKAEPVDNVEAMLTSTGEKQEMTVVTNTQKPAPSRLSESATAPSQPQALSLGAMSQESKRRSLGNDPSDEAYRRGSLSRFGSSLQEEELEASRLSSMDPPAWMERLTSDSGALLSPLSTPPSLSPLTPMPLSAWSQEGLTISTLLPDIEPNLMPRQDGPETLWTEAVRQSGEDTVAPLSQDEATEGTMSSEALPLIFEPFEDVVTPEGGGGGGPAAVGAGGVTLLPSPVGSQPPPAAMATGGMLLLADVDLDPRPPSPLVTVETDGDAAAAGPSPPAPPSLLLPDWMSPWQTSGAAESSLDPPIAPSGPSAAPPPPETDATGLSERGADGTEDLKVTGSSVTSTRFSATTVAMAPHRALSNSMSGLEAMESEEEPDEDEEDENTEESDEEDSDEDLTEVPQTAPTTRPPYSIIPPPPVWVQRNQGLMRSWVELIREKAGYVSGMLAPVGIGITGALLIVGALYSIRMIHRKRRNSYKHQRRKARQPQQPREPGPARQDQAMLLADSSEDEF